MVFFYFFAAVFYAKGFSPPEKRSKTSASVLLLVFKMRQWDVGKKQGVPL